MAVTLLDQIESYLLEMLRHTQLEKIHTEKELCSVSSNVWEATAKIEVQAIIPQRWLPTLDEDATKIQMWIVERLKSSAYQSPLILTSTEKFHLIFTGCLPQTLTGRLNAAPAPVRRVRFTAHIKIPPKKVKAVREPKWI